MHLYIAEKLTSSTIIYLRNSGLHHDLQLKQWLLTIPISTKQTTTSNNWTQNGSRYIPLEIQVQKCDSVRNLFSTLVTTNIIKLRNYNLYCFVRHNLAANMLLSLPLYSCETGFLHHDIAAKLGFSSTIITEELWFPLTL